MIKGKRVICADPKCRKPFEPKTRQGRKSQIYCTGECRERVATRTSHRRKAQAMRVALRVASKDVDQNAKRSAR